MAHIPNAFEQAMLEHINRARMDPAGEADLILLAAQGNIVSALKYFGVDVGAFRAQMTAYDPVAPLAWNAALATAADRHGQRMIDEDTQSHQLRGEASLGARITEAGYTRWSNLGENIYTYTQDPLHGHAGFMVDWGYDDADFSGDSLRADWQSIGDGMQDAAGHRNAILAARYVDIGISALAETDSGTQVGPWVVTQDFGTLQGPNPAQLLGVVINDADGDSFYDIGEGVGGVTVTAAGQAGSFTTTTWASGGYQMELPTGLYTVRFTAPDMSGSADYDVAIDGRNVKQDILLADLLPATDDPTQTGTTGRDILSGTGDSADRLTGLGGDDVLMGDGLQAVYFPQVSAQVYRLYQAVLGRSPDSAGHLAWVGRLALEGREIKDVAQGFMGSREFQSQFAGLDDDEFVALLYNNVLDRAPDTPGLANWTAKLAMGADRAEVVLGFSDSYEFIRTTAVAADAFAKGNAPMLWGDDVYRLYQATLDRAPDLTGFLDWSARLGSGTSFEQVARGFVGSAEFIAAYDAPDNGGFVDLLYQNVLKRPGDDAGRADWIARLDAGVSRAQVVQGFSQSAEFVKRTAADFATWVLAQGTDDIISGGVGDNMLAGGALSDIFVFEPVVGDSVILDMESWDKLDLTAMDYNSRAEIRADFRQEGADAVLDNGTGTTITLLDFGKDMISNDMILI